jgi:hypothetical protein
VSILRLSCMHAENGSHAGYTIDVWGLAWMSGGESLRLHLIGNEDKEIGALHLRHRSPLSSIADLYCQGAFMAQRNPVPGSFVTDETVVGRPQRSSHVGLESPIKRYLGWTLAPTTDGHNTGVPPTGPCSHPINRGQLWPILLRLCGNQHTQVLVSKASRGKQWMHGGACRVREIGLVTVRDPVPGGTPRAKPAQWRPWLGVSASRSRCASPLSGPASLLEAARGS